MTFDFDVKVSSPYDTPRRHADGLRVNTLGGELPGERKLLHDHQDEQPFTRDLYSVKISRAVKKVVIEARDEKHGYGGRVTEVALPGRWIVPGPLRRARVVDEGPLHPHIQ